MLVYTVDGRQPFVARLALGMEQKDRERDKLLDLILELPWERTRNRVRFLTLPAAWWIFEKALLRARYERERRYHLSFTALERNYRIFRLACLKMPRVDKRYLHLNRYDKALNCQVVTNAKDIVLLNADAGSFMKLTDKKFDVIWLDLCAPISEEILGLVSMAGKIFRKGLALFALNVQGARESVSVGEDRQEFLRAACTSRLGEGWTGAVSSYCDSVPMLQAVFVRRDNAR